MARKPKKAVDILENGERQDKIGSAALEERVASLESNIDKLTQLMDNLGSQINQLNSRLELDLSAKRNEEEAKKLRRDEMLTRGLRFVVLLYLAAMLFCVVMIVKPGARIFYYQQTVENQKIELLDSGVYSYALNTNGLLYPLDGVLFYKDSELLVRAGKVANVKAGEGRFTISDPSQKPVYVYFSSVDKIDPRQGGSTYRIYYPLAFASRSMGIFYLVVLFLGVVWYLYRKLRNVELRQNFVAALKNIYADISSNASPWLKLFVLVTGCAYLYVFMEWLFLITMPSFMSALSLQQKLAILIVSGLVVALLCLLVLFIAFLIDTILLYLKVTRRFVFAGVLVPAAILAGLSILLFDNFTYTLFKSGVVSSVGPWRGAYALALIILLVIFIVRLLPYTGLARNPASGWQISPRMFYLAGGLLLISAVIALASFQRPVDTAAASESKAGKTSRLPNILLLGSDGLRATMMSLYGYKRDTTPRLVEFSRTSLLPENAYPNGYQSTGSIVSIFTSKLPTKTRVMYAPDILTGVDAYQHLPGILHAEGYRTVQLAVTHYIDARDVNLQNGFDSVNGQSVEISGLPLFLRENGFSHEAYLMQQLTKRMGDRLRHIFYIQDMENPYRAVTQPTTNVSFMSDQEKIDKVIDLLTNSSQPVFLHVHLMGTHGPMFEPRQSVFSKGEEQTETWMIDFYNDSILDFDRYVGEVIDTLEEAGKLDDTIIIIYSDHSERYAVQRIPLLFHFPKDEYAGRIQANVQNLDIAPTILDYLGMPVPDWMDGQSLLHGDLDPHRLIFTVGNREDALISVTYNYAILDSSLLGPPFFQFGQMVITDCQQWYRVNLVTQNWMLGDYGGYFTPCAYDSLHSYHQIQQAVTDQLAGDGFDVSGLSK